MGIEFLHPGDRKGKVVLGKNVSGIEISMIDATGDVTIGNDVIFSRDTMIFTHEHYKERKETVLKQRKRLGLKISNIVIGDDVYFGARCMIMCNVTNIPKGTVIGAGAILTKNPKNEYEIWAGNPAKKIGERK